MKKIFLHLITFLFSLVLLECGSYNIWTGPGDDEYDMAMGWKERAEKTTGAEQKYAYEKYYELLNSSLNDYNTNLTNPLIPVSETTIYASKYCWACTEVAEINKNYETAINCHKKRLELFPDDLHSYAWLINLYNETKEYKKAISLAEQMLNKILIQSQEDKYDSSFVLRWLIDLNNKNENYKTSLKFAELLGKSNKLDDVDFYYIGATYGYLCDENKKIFYWKKAATLGNDYAIRYLTDHGIKY